ncbi:nucleobase-ascorbate transporter 12-like isoform X2 [Magnolia sinica]|uniref:nucleobase-ascorbate transporter 12-like isoform X2 n=1 Tax=Magnolia sinica TaxID=86752 RepID=UPI002657B31B|nr:nucleobase-ascorbate transporter 12-like isoform X2 [Magnolia sinica]
MSSSDAPKQRPRPGPWPPAPPADPPPSMPPASWAKRTGFRPHLSGETTAGDSGRIVATVKPKEPELPPDLESGRPANGVSSEKERMPAQQPLDRDQAVTVKKKRESDGGAPGMNGPVRSDPTPLQPKPSQDAEVVDMLPHSHDDEGFTARHSHMKYELRDTPGLVSIGLFGFQHYISMFGSLILIPLVIVPAMGGTPEDTAKVVSTVLFVSGLTTLLHTLFGSRLPLIQGPSYVYLAPALALIHSPEFLTLNGNNFKYIMKELQGAIIISSAFQAIIGYSGLMAILLRLINPVVVAPTIAAIGLSFFSYGFPQVGTCLEIGVVQILLVIIFSLVPLALGITWAIAFLLTEAGVYSYKGCDVNVPSSNIISDACRKHFSRMKHCRVDTSHALKSSPWFRFPYPLQWGTPVFEWKMALVMCSVSIIASVDSVGSYHASSLLVASRPPTPGVLSRGIGLEGISSVLAGLWGTGTGSTTLTENIHTIAVTKMGSRRAVEIGACILILLSLIGKVGGFLASIPNVMVSALLCFMWAMLAALGLSNLRYSEAGSSRNIIIVGLSLFLSLSIPAYFQQYRVIPNTNSSVPSYFQPYIVASHGPFRSKYGGLNYVLNTLLSFHMVIAFLVAVILDNTVPGSQQERGVYVWSEPEAARREPSVAKDYELPFRVGRALRWVKWVGL